MTQFNLNSKLTCIIFDKYFEKGEIKTYISDSRECDIQILQNKGSESVIISRNDIDYCVDKNSIFLYKTENGVRILSKKGLSRSMGRYIFFGIIDYAKKRFSNISTVLTQLKLRGLVSDNENIL